MSVTAIHPKWEGRGGSTDEKGIRTLKRAWVVETSADSDAENVVVDGLIAIDASAALFASHPSYPKAICRKIDPTPHEGPRTWWVVAEYSTAPFTANGDGGASGVPDAGSGTTPATAAGSQNTPANDRPPTIRVDEREIVEPHVYDVVEVDDNGEPVAHLNTLGDKFDPPEEIPHAYHVITWTFYRTPAELMWATRSQFLDSVNSDAVNILGHIYDPDTLRCKRYSVESVWETGATGLELFYLCTVVAEEDPRGYMVSTLNTGRRAASFSEVVTIVDQNGQPVADPVPLTQGGLVVDPDAVPSEYYYVRSNGYVPKAWNGSGSNLFSTGGLLW